ncbi:MAG TPA: hypothetical protein VG370_27795 [Chloroflexota bacterium]|jgi:hypothetical protein|nr:hypothetical protein [Chloroflexota bacterium]
MEGIGPRRISLTTWVVLTLCAVAGVVAVAMTAVVIVRLNRQILASAAELRATLSAPSPAPADGNRSELLQYAAKVEAIESAWAAAVADYRLRYPNNRIYESVATAQAIAQINAMRRPPSVGGLHERWAQAWSDRDAALAILGRPGATEEEVGRAAELGRRAADEIRRVRNELSDLLLAQGISQPELAAAKLNTP